MSSAKNFTAKSDEEIVKYTLKDKDVYWHLIHRYEAKLLRYIRRSTNANEQDAEDILQDVFIKAYQNLNDFDTSLKFSSWIYRICHNEIINYWRKSSRQGAVHLELFENDARMANHEPLWKELEIKLDKAKIDVIFEKMPLKYRDVLILRFLEEKNYQEMSDILKMPVGTVGTMLLRAKKVFQKTAEKLTIKF